ncbi:hypothetical protein JTE90_029184 [Oedothorax gibbosus]|uniref:Calponin-homology (CH) domain-containing protein n=1 Tax=Oedothorax gibbosus TaxID=931172 RepID=A0AAV6VFU9_9ARAC|nr:hypothetical protein JTE90_029184 [Oedothorax gibbosus]
MSVDQPEAVVENLRQERLNVQKKTFTKWANVHLQKHGLQIDDIFVDLGDGLRLMKLLESLTGEKLGKPAKGSARINKIENVSRCLAFLHSKKMRLENISSEDIVDGKPHLILGLLWMIILRCEIWQHQENSNNQKEAGYFIPEPPQNQQHFPVQKIAKESLLLWCQTKTDGYPGVRVRDFHRSWRDGLAFNALIHSHLPKLVDFNSLKSHEHVKNLNNAFNVASKYIGVPKLLDPEDVDTDNPDEKSIIIYVSTFSKGLDRFKKGITVGKRITNVLVNMMEIEKMKSDYSKKATDILDWIYSKLEEFKYFEPIKSLEDIQQEIHNFKDYRLKEKPLKNEQKNEIEALLFAIQMKRLGRAGWVPTDETSPAEIEKAWRQLERAEHDHETEVRSQLKEQERLENLAFKFESKKSVRENFLKEMQKVLTDPNYGSNIKQADATFKKHEAIRTGIISREIMMHDLFKIADTLINANYRRKDEIVQWKNEMEENWNYVLRLLEAYDEKFAHLRQVMNILEEADVLLEEINEMQADLDSESEPLDVEESLKRFALKEVQVTSWGEAVRRLEAKIESHVKAKDAAVLQNQMNKLRQAHQSVVETCSIRRDALEDHLAHYQYQQQVQEMMAWIQEMKLYCTTDVKCKDLASATLMHKNHKALSSEVQARKDMCKEMQDDRLKKAFEELEELWKQKGDNLSFMIKTYQYSADADECDSWISEKLHLLSSLDCGSDDFTCEALLRRHLHIQREISTDLGEIERLRREADSICATISKKQNAAPQILKTPVKSSQPHVTEVQVEALTKTQIYDRQTGIENSFTELQRKCEERRLRLSHNNMYFRFKDGCKTLESWMREKERMLDSNDFGKDADEVEKNFEIHITELASRGTTVDELKQLAEALGVEKAEQAKTAEMQFNDVFRRWQHLHDITSLKEKNLKGFTSVLLAHRVCDETSIWLSEKCAMEYLDTSEDIKSLDTLRRKQEAIEREVIPAEERMKQALVLAENVANSYPDQSDSIQTRIRAVNDQWEMFQKKILERKQAVKDSAGLQILNTSLNSLMEWANLLSRKLSVREKIGDLAIAENISKEHKELGDEIVSQDEKFYEVEQLGEQLSEKHESVNIRLEQLQEARKTVHELWQDKEIWLQQRLDVQVFNREADQLSSMCTSHDTLLDAAVLGDTLSDVEMQIRHHDAFMESLNGQDNRFESFKQMTNTLIAAEHIDSDYIRNRCNQVLEHRKNTKEKAEIRRFLLMDAYEFQEFRADAQELLTWIAEKSKLAADLAKQDSSSNILYKMKRQKTFEAEIAANECRLKHISSIGESIINKDSNVAADSVEPILEDIQKAWNELCEDMEANQKTLQQVIVLRDFSTSVENVLNKLDNIGRSLSSSTLGKDLRSVQNSLKAVEMIEIEKDTVNLKVSDLIQQGRSLIQDRDSVTDNVTENTVKRLIEEMQQKSNALEVPLEERKMKLQTCLKFYQFKSDVDRELLWISDQLATLSTTTNCRNLFEAQKFQKKIDNFKVALESHSTIIESLQEKVLVLVTEEECPVDVTHPSTLMKQQLNLLIQEFNIQKEKASIALRLQSFLCEANEIDAWITEKLEILSNTDYGKDEDAVVKLLTKHKALELEIDSYKGLVDELAAQADALIESNHQDSKIVKNRMEVINQEMKNIEKLCTVKREKLLESKSRHEFINETEELNVWISEQMTEATSEDFGEDYEHVLVLHQNFEFFRAKVEGGSKRILQYEEFAKRLMNGNCYFIADVEHGLEQISASWSELLECIDARAFKTEAAAEIHRYHRDVTDILFRINSHYGTIPQDLGNNRIHVQDLIKKHDTIENELLGIEAQVHLLLEDSRRLQEAYPGGNEEHIQMQLSLVIEHWNMLQQKVSSRKAQLLTAERIHKFLASVREEESWSKEIILELVSESTSRDVQQMDNDHKLLGVDIETHFGHFESLKEEGQALLEFEILTQQVEDKLKSLSTIQTRVQEIWERRSSLVEQKKNAFLFFHEAKQIQASYAKREVQLCGSENKETVEDIDIALKKHLEFQNSMDIQEEKFTNWKQLGESLLKQRNEDSEKIGKKMQDLSERRKRLLDYNAERTKSLSESLKLAKFKRDTIEAEAWLQEKKTKLRHVLKSYNQLGHEEKIKCLQKQQAVQAELDAHAPFINNIVQQSREIVAGEEVQTRLSFILEDWKEVKENASRLGNDLLQAREMLLIHDLFERTDEWIKEKELMIQANEVGKDYEHCLTLQAKLDDANSDNKVDESLLNQMKELAFKLSRKEEHQGVSIRYERICERWNWLKQEIHLYRKKLRDAAQVHAFIKDIDDLKQRIREKILVLSSREETAELNVVQVMQRKLELIEQDLTALDKTVKVQENEAHFLAETHQLSSSKIMAKMDEVHKERKALEDELKEKKQYLDSAHTCLKFMKDVSDFAIIVHEMVVEMEFGDLPSNSIDAQSLLRAHNELQTQVFFRQKEIRDLQEYGKSIVRLSSAGSDGVEESIKHLQEMYNDLDIVWQNRLNNLLQCKDLQLFLEKAKLVENWLSTKEAFIAIQNKGDSMSSVEALIRKQEVFEETCYANFEKIQEIEWMVRDLKDHEEFDTIQLRCEDICKRRDALREACQRRKEILQDSKAFQQLLLEMYEITNWMSAKIRVASDDSYRDLTNLLSKSQKNAAFEAEILANHSRVVDIKKQAESLIEEGHFASIDIQNHVENLEDLWERLMTATTFKKERLREAYEALQCKHKLDDINSWLEETEAQIEYEEYDTNVASLQLEINKNQELQKVAEEYSENLRLLSIITEEFDQKNHFSKDEIKSQYKSTFQRFCSVENTLARKGNNLQESFLLAGVGNDIDDELSWIEENIITCETDQPYQNVMTVQSLQKKLQALETEMVSREPLITSIIDRGRRSRNEHAEKKIQELERRFNYLKDAISLKRLRLADALVAQTYYFEATQAEMWMKEKLAQVIGSDIERDVYSIQSLQKKLSAIEAATDGFRQSIQTLQESSSDLIDRGILTLKTFKLNRMKLMIFMKSCAKIY